MVKRMLFAFIYTSAGKKVTIKKIVNGTLRAVYEYLASIIADFSTMILRMDVVTYLSQQK